MDEEKGVKAPVTRLRRRLSTEAEGAQSPLTPSTPTKKRSTRLAKPALELIEENGKSSPSETVPKRGKATKDIADEAPVTPSRRSTRVRSNTSLVADAVQNSVTDSPRAKRAYRRASQIGSDTESTTPARQTRRTRKDSTSSVEKLAVTNSNEKAAAQVVEAISEEPEKDIKESKHDISNKTTPVRKSPRLNKKGKTISDEVKAEDNEKVQQDDKAFNSSLKLTNNILPSPKESARIEEATSSTQDNVDTESETKESDIKNISHNSAKLIDEISSPKKAINANKTMSAIEELKNDKGNRKRTKSWTTLTTGDPPTSASADDFTGKIMSPNKSQSKSVKKFNTSLENKENIQMLKAVDTVDASNTIKMLEKDPDKNIQSFVLMEDSDSNSGSGGKLTMDLGEGDGQKYEGDDQCVPIVKHVSPKRLPSESFTVEPMDIDVTIPGNVTLNDFSDKSNTSSEGNIDSELKQNTSLPKEQLSDMNKISTRTSSISVHEEKLNNSRRKSSLNIDDDDDKNPLDKSNTSSLTGKSRRKSSLSSQYESGDNLEKKSKRKSSLSKAESDNNNDKRKSSISIQGDEKLNETSNVSKNKSVSENLEKTSNENKSTLVLSQLKDVSAENETSNVAKSPSDTSKNLSKSVNNPSKDIKNIYLTSTPLQQKPLQKLAMQINTSVITPNSEINTSKTDKTKSPVKNNSDAGHDTDSSADESDDDSQEKSNVIDDEAEEASDDYESGDSRDEEERQYEEDNEIPEKGETLESEANFSNDSDYEKDSFIVSSDEEDEELLSGSGDDISLSDNELKMTAKSKKKYDERKRKEQKKASREMYEARHKLNEADKSSRCKNKKSKMETSALELENEEESKPKKKNRLRIDSSQEMSMDVDESVVFKKKKSKRLSESVCEDIPNEKEITINNQSISEKLDPLSAAIKKEPKTPLKDFNMSTVLINHNIEQVEVDTNASILKPNETSDPLQATLAQDDEESDSDISENMEIKDNYDSVLKNLNMSNKKQKMVKTVDTSLNLNKKVKDTEKDPIVDQLNLTQAKKSKKSKAQKVPKTYENIEEPKTVKNKNVSTLMDKNDDGENSDSIDMRLLFSEESNDSEANISKFKPNKKETTEDLIPLKRTEAKTNIRESLVEPEDTNLGFFIDTKGDYGDNNTSIQNSAKKKKKHKLSVSEINITDDVEAESLKEPEKTADESLMNSGKKKKKNKSISEWTASEETIINVSQTSEKKKKKNKSLHENSEVDENEGQEEASINVSTNTHKKKKNKSHLDSSHIVDDTVPEESTANISQEKHKKKKNKSLLDNSQMTESENYQEIQVNVSADGHKKKKNKQQMNDFQKEEATVVEETPENISHKIHKKKKNKSENIDAFDREITETEEVKQKHGKKMKSRDVVDNAGNQSDEAPLEVAYKSEKKSDNPELVEEDDTVNKSKNKFKKKKKKSKAIQPEVEVSAEQEIEGKAKKRKREFCSNAAENIDDEIQMSKSQKKKKFTENYEDDNAIIEETRSKPKKRKATDDHVAQENSKVFKGNFFKKVHVSRLPESIVSQLDDQPAENKKQKKIQAISTVPFLVEEGPRRKNKPSNYLEQSIYLNDSTSPEKQKHKSIKKAPKVLPFTPTAITSEEGYTTNFKINVLPQNNQFVAQANTVYNFRDQYLSKQRVKKLRVERFKKHNNYKLDKF